MSGDTVQVSREQYNRLLGVANLVRKGVRVLLSGDTVALTACEFIKLRQLNTALEEQLIISTLELTNDKL